MARQTAAPANLGSWLLCRVPDSTKRLKEAGVSASQISYWRTGRRPDGKNLISDRYRTELRTTFGIPRDAWRKPSPTTPEEEAEALKRLTEPTPEPAPQAPAEPVTVDASSPEALTALIQQAITQAASIAEVQERTKVIAQLTRSMEVVQRTTGEHALTTAKILQHPETRRVIATIVGALSGGKHTEALKAVKAALDGLAA
ncbi:MAG: hypothetical protein KF764_03040 [Labilithrix sp.]|nr:hypothetical protein [Labilithrix sp.]